MSNMMDQHLDKVKEPEAVPGGEEYQLQISSAQVVPSKSSPRDIVKVSYKILDKPGAATVFDNMSIPIETDTEENIQFFMLNFKRFHEAFGFKMNGALRELLAKVGEWKGATAWNTLKQKDDERTGITINELGTWIKKK